MTSLFLLIHLADPQSRPGVIIVFAQVVRPNFLKSSKTKRSSENNVHYWRDCGSGRVDHWWHLSCLLAWEKIVRNVGRCLRKWHWKSSLVMLFCLCTTNLCLSTSVAKINSTCVVFALLKNWSLSCFKLQITLSPFSQALTIFVWWCYTENNFDDVQSRGVDFNKRTVMTHSYSWV